jgi:hypothetical protein
MGFIIIKLVSSAKMTGLELILLIFDKSLIETRKRKGPSIDPRGTQYCTLPQLEKIFC